MGGACGWDILRRGHAVGKGGVARRRQLSEVTDAGVVGVEIIVFYVRQVAA